MKVFINIAFKRLFDVMEKRDIVVVGGGCAGLTAAKKLAEEKTDFVLLEADGDFFMKACGEGLPLLTGGYNMIDLAGSKTGLENGITAVEIYHGNELTARVEGDQVGYCMNKRDFERGIAEQALKLGGEIRMKSPVHSIEVRSDGILVKPQDILCKCIIGADGSKSKVRSMFTQPIKDLLLAVYKDFPKTEEDHTLKFYMGIDVIKEGYAWNFPKKDLNNIGIGSAKIDAVVPAWKKFIGEQNIAGFRGAYIPFEYPKKSYFNRCVLIGDAAAHVNMLTGGGINYAMVAGDIAGDVISKISKKHLEFSEANLKEYEDRCRKVFYPELRVAAWFSKVYMKLGLYNSRIFFKIVSKLFIERALKTSF